MKNFHRALLIGLCAVAAGGCAVGKEMGWYGNHQQPTEVVVASCEAATATLKERPDHAISYRACLDAKTRQGVD